MGEIAVKAMLDFKKWPLIQSAPAVIRQREDLRDILKIFPKTLKHIDCCVYFAAQVARAHPHDFSLTLREACLRAALMEFTLIENAMKQDNMPTQKNPNQFTYFHETDEPLLHLIRLLRNYELHLTPSTLSPAQVDVFWGDPSEPKVPEQYFAITI